MPRRCLHGVHLRSEFGINRVITFASALPARGASCHADARQRWVCFASALPARGASLANIYNAFIKQCFASALPARGASTSGAIWIISSAPLPRRCLHGVHPGKSTWAHMPRFFASALPARGASPHFPYNPDCFILCLGAACTGCILPRLPVSPLKSALPRRCLHGVHPGAAGITYYIYNFASALPARGASWMITLSLSDFFFASALPARGASLERVEAAIHGDLCLGAACTGCISTG